MFSFFSKRRKRREELLDALDKALEIYDDKILADAYRERIKMMYRSMSLSGLEERAVAQLEVLRAGLLAKERT